MTLHCLQASKTNNTEYLVDPRLYTNILISQTHTDSTNIKHTHTHTLTSIPVADFVFVAIDNISFVNYLLLHIYLFSRCRRFSDEHGIISYFGIICDVDIKTRSSFLSKTCQSHDTHIRINHVKQLLPSTEQLHETLVYFFIGI